MLLEIVVLCGTFSQDEACATLLVKAGLPELLITCLKGRAIAQTHKGQFPHAVLTHIHNERIDRGMRA